MAVQLILKNSAVQDKEATAAQLAAGEIALNYHSSGPFLQCEDTAGNIWRLGGVTIASTAPSSPSKGAWWLDSDDNHLYFYDGSSWIEIQTGEIVPGDITEGTARQLLQTNAAGNGTEWTSNIDVPGTLDVTGVATFDNNVVITGNLTVNGTTTTIDTTTLVVEDKNIELGVVGTPTDTTADGGGITVKGATDKTLTWVNSTGMWTSNQPFDVAGELQCDSLDVDGVADISGNLTLHGSVFLDDNDTIYLGTGNDLAIYHNGSGSYIDDTGTGDLRIRANNLSLQKYTGENYFVGTADGAAYIYYDSAEKLATTSTGIDVTGAVTCDGLTVDGQGTFAASAEYQAIIKDNNNTGTAAETGIAFADSANTVQGFVGLNEGGNDDLYLKNVRSGSVRFGTSNSDRCLIDSNGHFKPNATNTYDLGTSSNQWRDGYFDGTVNCDLLDVDGEADITGNVTLHGDLDLQDLKRILLGTGDDLQISHDGTNSYTNNYTGDLYIQNWADDKAIILQTDNGSGGVTEFLRCDGNNGEVDLYHYGSQKLRTTSGGVNVTGQVVCDGLVVDGGVTFSNGTGQLDLKDNNNTGNAAIQYVRGISSDNTQQWYVGNVDSGADIYFGNSQNGSVIFQTNNSSRAYVSAAGNFEPASSGVQSLGGVNRWNTLWVEDVNFSGFVKGVERTATASSFDMSTGNFWTFGAIAVPNPTNQSAGMMGSLRVTAAPTSFAANWKFPGGSYTAPTSFPAVAPFFVQASGTILVGSWTEGIA